MAKPEPGDYAAYYQPYIGLLTEEDPLKALENAQQTADRVLTTLPSAIWRWAYQPGKWSVAELVMHMADTERIFNYRALRIARGDEQELPGFDQDRFVKASKANQQPVEALVEDARTVRACSLSLFKSFGPDELRLTGICNSNRVTVNAIPFIIAGHQLHHIRILEERYLEAFVP